MRRTVVDFSKTLRDWDGFGVNYVEAAQTRDYETHPQEYGGFSLLSEANRQQILDMIFGEAGLKPGLVKMFLDPFHQAEPGDTYDFDPNVIDPHAYDHETTTQWMRYFVKQGLAKTRARGMDLEIITTLYSPPAWTTQQKFIRGRDLDPEYKFEVAKYLIAWAKYLRETESLPVNYIGLHNEGEDWMRWPPDGNTADAPRHDYNMYWPPEQVVDFLRFMPAMLEAQGMEDVGLAPGETSNWYRFSAWGYADAIADDPEAVQNLGLITSHGFKGASQPGRWYGDWRSLGIDILRAASLASTFTEGLPSSTFAEGLPSSTFAEGLPSSTFTEGLPSSTFTEGLPSSTFTEGLPTEALHAWVTSTSWSDMDVLFVNELRNNIYCAKVNGIIPWACVQRPGKWVGGDPNPGCAFRVYDDGSYEIMPGYHYFKQVSRAGQPGMRVARVLSNDSTIGLIAFAHNGTAHPDAFVVLNMAQEVVPLEIQVLGSTQTAFEAYRTAPGENYVYLDTYAVEDNQIAYTAPAGSVTTFFSKA